MSHLLPRITSQFKNFGSVISSVAGGSASLASSLKLAGGGASILSGVFSSSLPIILGVSTAIAAIVAIAPTISDWFKTLTGDVEYLNEKIEEANTTIETNNERLSELSEVPWYDRTPEIESETKALQEQNEELEKNKVFWADYMSPDGGDMSFSTTGYKLIDRTRRGTKTYAGETLQEAAEDLIPEVASMSVEELQEQLEELGIIIEETTVEVERSEEELTQYGNDIAKSIMAIANAQEFDSSTLNELGSQMNSTIEAMQAQAVEYQTMIDNNQQLSESQQEFLDTYNSLVYIKDNASKLINTQNELNKAVELTSSKYADLVKLYPELRNYSTQTVNGYQLEIEALIDLAEAGEQWAIDMIASQEDVTKETLEQMEARLEAEKAWAGLYLRTSDISQQYVRDYYSGLVDGIQDLATAILLIKQKVNLNAFTGNDDDKNNGIGGISSTGPSLIEQQNELFKERLEIMEDNLYFMQKSGATEEEQIAQLKKMQQEVHEQADWYRSQGLAEDSEYLRESGHKWLEYYDEIQSIIENSLKKREQEWKDSINEEIDSLQKLVDKYETAFSYVINKAQDEIDALEEQKESIQQQYDDEIAALEEQNNELERQIELEEYLDALARAKQSKVMVYKDGRFQYVNDIDEVSEAQANLDRFQQEEALRQEIENLETSRDKEIAVIEDKIKYWEKMKEEWSDAVDQYTEEQDRLIAEQILGIELEGENWETRLNNLQDYVNEYNSILSQLQIAKDELEQGYENQSSSSSTSVSSGGTSSNINDPFMNEEGWYDVSNKPSQDISDEDWHNFVTTGHYASGTHSASGGISLVGENGPELRVLNSGDGVIPSEITKNLWKWGQISPFDSLKGLVSTINIGTINLPGVSNGEQFVNYLRNNLWRKTVQFQTS